MAKTNDVNVQLRKALKEKNLLLFCAELKDHIETALGDLLEPDEVKIIDIDFYPVLTRNDYWHITIKTELLLIHPEVLGDIQDVVYETVRLHADTFSPPPTK